MKIARFIVPILSFLIFPASAQTSVGTYSAFWLGLPVGTVTISNSLAPGAGNRPYAFSMTLQSGGILGSSRFTTTFSGRGNLRGRGLNPSRGHFVDVRRGETRSETITFSNGIPRFTSVPQYLVPDEFKFDLAQARNSLDPSAGLFMLLYAASIGDCDRNFTVFDGFSLYAASITDEGQENVRTEQFTGPTQRCRLSLTPIAGKAAVFGSFTVPEMAINVASLTPGAPALPVKGALFINGNRAGLRFDGFEVQ